uniref:Uncharacterized protein n=1 Tax=Timema monikensis TaxID=170555 RepID=A0A7R9ECE4_9NEOP|nr:unnamed protein product [Timema monikensis]
MDVLIPEDSPEEGDEGYERDRQDTTVIYNNEDAYVDLVTQDEIKWPIAGFRKKKAPIYDGIRVEVIHAINEWCKNVKFSLAPVRTTYMLLMVFLKSIPMIKIAELTILRCKFVKNLGVMIDEKRNFFAHIGNLSGRALMALNKIALLVSMVGHEAGVYAQQLGEKMSKRKLGSLQSFWGIQNGTYERVMYHPGCMAPRLKVAEEAAGYWFKKDKSHSSNNVWFVQHVFLPAWTTHVHCNDNQMSTSHVSQNRKKWFLKCHMSFCPSVGINHIYNKLQWQVTWPKVPGNHLYPWLSLMIVAQKLNIQIPCGPKRQKNSLYKIHQVLIKPFLKPPMHLKSRISYNYGLSDTFIKPIHLPTIVNISDVPKEHVLNGTAHSNEEIYYSKLSPSKNLQAGAEDNRRLRPVPIRRRPELIPLDHKGPVAYVGYSSEEDSAYSKPFVSKKVQMKVSEYLLKTLKTQTYLLIRNTSLQSIYIQKKNMSIIPKDMFQNTSLKNINTGIQHIQEKKTQSILNPTQLKRLRLEAQIGCEGKMELEGEGLYVGSDSVCVELLIRAIVHFDGNTSAVRPEPGFLVFPLLSKVVLADTSNYGVVFYLAGLFVEFAASLPEDFLQSHTTSGSVYVRILDVVLQHWALEQADLPVMPLKPILLRARLHIPERVATSRLRPCRDLPLSIASAFPPGGDSAMASALASPRNFNTLLPWMTVVPAFPFVPLSCLITFHTLASPAKVFATYSFQLVILRV